MSWFWTILFLTSFAISCNSSEANNNKHQKKSSVVVVGTVYCGTCFQQDIPKARHIIAGKYGLGLENLGDANPDLKLDIGDFCPALSSEEDDNGTLLTQAGTSS